MNCTVGCDFQLPYDSGTTNFTCQQLIDYCQAYTKCTTIENYINHTVKATLLVAGLGGLISYILMIIVFRSPDYNGPSYIYHKAIVWIELVHMVVMECAAWHRHFKFAPTYSYVIYNDLFRELWIFGDAMKLSASMVTTFLSMERFVALWYPASFALINTPKIAWSFIIISLLSGLLHITHPFLYDIHPQTGNGTEGLFVAVPKGEGVHVAGDLVVSDLIYSVKGITSVFMIVFCIGVAAGLILKSKKSNTMSSTAKSKWKENRRLSILQIAIAVLQIIDHIFWVTSYIIQDKQPVPFFLGIEAVTTLDFSFEQAMQAVEYRELEKWGFGCQSMSGALDHSTRLFLYWIGMKSFKEGLIGLFRKADVGANVQQSPSFRKSTSKASRGNAVVPMGESGC